MIVACPDSLRGVFNDLELELTRHHREHIHLGRLAVQMHRHHCLDPAAGALVSEARAAQLALLREKLEQPVGGNVVRRRIDVDEDRSCADARNGAAGRKERVWRGEHLIARADAERHQRD